MLRLLLIGILTAAGTTAGLVAPSFLKSSPEEVETTEPSEPVTATFVSEFIPIPRVFEGQVTGYLVGRFNVYYSYGEPVSYEPYIHAAMVHAITHFFFQNASQTYLIGGSMEPAEIGEKLRASVAEELPGLEIIKVEMRQIDYMERDDVRRSILERGKSPA